MLKISMNIAVKQPTFLLISLFISVFPFMESAQSQTAPLIKGRSAFAPYQPEPKFAPAIGGRASNQATNQTSGQASGQTSDQPSGQFSQQPANQFSNQGYDQTGDQTTGKGAQPETNSEPFTVTPDGTPALNIVPTVDRPPIPPPPNAAPLRPSGNGVAQPAQAWRVKAFQLFKQKLDPNTTIALVLNANYNNALQALRQAFEDEGLTVSGLSANSGHMLITLNSNGNSSLDSNGGDTTSRSEKAIVALRPALAEAKAGATSVPKTEAKTDSKTEAKTEPKTELRVMCESRNRRLTCLRMKEILNKVQNKFGDIKTDAETL